nr:hypothetical protein [Tanacetum cinerariifolium]
AVDGVGQRKHRQAACDHEDRIEAVGQIDPVDQLQHQPAATQADDPADAEFLNQVPQQAPVQAGLAACKHVDQGDGEEHRHRVIAAGFDFKAGRDPFVQAFTAEQREDRCSVRGADDGADQQALNDVQVEQPGRDHAGQPRGDQHADRGQRQGGPERHAKACHPRSQAAVEQDHGECEVADQISRRVVVEDDAAAVHARDHADRQDDHQNRDAQARGKRADQNTCTHQQRADQEQAVDGRGIQGRYSRRKQKWKARAD